MEHHRDSKGKRIDIVWIVVTVWVIELFATIPPQWYDYPPVDEVFEHWLRYYIISLLVFQICFTTLDALLQQVFKYKKYDHPLYNFRSFIALVINVTSISLIICRNMMFIDIWRVHRKEHDHRDLSLEEIGEELSAMFNGFLIIFTLYLDMCAEDETETKRRWKYFFLKDNLQSFFVVSIFTMLYNYAVFLLGRWVHGSTTVICSCFLIFILWFSLLMMRYLNESEDNNDQEDDDITIDTDDEDEIEQIQTAISIKDKTTQETLQQKDDDCVEYCKPNDQSNSRENIEKKSTKCDKNNANEISLRTLDIV